MGEILLRAKRVSASGRCVARVKFFPPCSPTWSGPLLRKGLRLPAPEGLGKLAFGLFLQVRRCGADGIAKRAELEQRLQPRGRGKTAVVGNLPEKLLGRDGEVEVDCHHRHGNSAGRIPSKEKGKAGEARGSPGVQHPPLPSKEATVFESID